MSGEQTEEIDTMNRAMVGRSGRGITIGALPVRLTPNQAVVAAAWLLALSEDEATIGIDQALAAVRGT